MGAAAAAPRKVEGEKRRAGKPPWKNARLHLGPPPGKHPGWVGESHVGTALPPGGPGAKASFGLRSTNHPRSRPPAPRAPRDQLPAWNAASCPERWFIGSVPHDPDAGRFAANVAVQHHHGARSRRSPPWSRAAVGRPRPTSPRRQRRGWADPLRRASPGLAPVHRRSMGSEWPVRGPEPPPRLAIGAYRHSARAKGGSS